MPNDSSSHLDDEAIELYSGGKATQAEEEAWEEHLLVCEACRERLEFTETFAKSMKAAGAEWKRRPQEAASRVWSLGRLIPVFGALAAAALLLAIWLHVGGLATGQRAPAVVMLHAMRGAGAPPAAPAGRPLALRLDVTELSPATGYRVEIVGATGKSIWSGDAVVRGADAQAVAPAETAGSYYVRLYSADGELLREYALTVGASD